MKRSLMRPSATFLPLTLLLAGLQQPAAAVMLAALICAMQLCTLCAADSFRNAAAREPGVRRVDRRFGGAIVQMLVGFTLFCGVGHALRDRIVSLMGSAAEMLPCLTIASGCVLIEQLFEERAFALARRMDGTILSGVSSLLLLVGLSLDAAGGVEAPAPACFTACAAGVGAAIAIITSFTLERAHGFALVPRNLAFAPKAMLQTLLCPAVIIAAFVLTRGQNQTIAEIQPAALLAAWMLWRLARTVSRRSDSESRPLNFLAVTITAIAIVVSLWVNSCIGLSAALVLTLICIAAVFCRPTVRLWVGVALNAAAFVLFTFGPVHSYPMQIRIAVCIACAVAVGINLKHAFLRRV